jgi:hypothetical protein
MMKLNRLENTILISQRALIQFDCCHGSDRNSLASLQLENVDREEETFFKEPVFNVSYAM